VLNDEMQNGIQRVRMHMEEKFKEPRGQRESKEEFKSLNGLLK